MLRIFAMFLSLPGLSPANRNVHLRTDLFTRERACLLERTHLSATGAGRELVHRLSEQIAVDKLCNPVPASLISNLSFAF
jgi:hypothetical protein